MYICICVFIYVKPLLFNFDGNIWIFFFFNLPSTVEECCAKNILLCILKKNI